MDVFELLFTSSVHYNKSWCTKEFDSVPFLTVEEWLNSNEGTAALTLLDHYKETVVCFVNTGNAGGGMSSRQSFCLHSHGFVQTNSLTVPDCVSGWGSDDPEISNLSPREFVVAISKHDRKLTEFDLIDHIRQTLVHLVFQNQRTTDLLQQAAISRAVIQQGYWDHVNHCWGPVKPKQ
jgi:hypothetical protein